VAEGGLERKVQQFRVTREHGSNLAATMGNILFPTLYVCVAELVSNSYDNDARRVDITLDPNVDFLAVTDDGTGMDEEGIRSFYRMGDSTKIDNPVSEGGRQRIGRHGIATLVLRRLCMHYVMKTLTEGSGFVIEEHFSDDDKDSKPISVRSVAKRDPARKDGRRGTSIVMDKLRFSPIGKELDLNELKRMLSIELPIGKDFEVYVNEDAVLPADIPKNAIEYVVDVRNDPLIGTVNGSIFFSARPPAGANSGLYIKVRGRAVGGDNLHTATDLPRIGLADKLFGVVHADGLADIIGFDRSRFIDHPKFRRLYSILKDMVRQVRTDSDRELKKEKKKSAQKKLEKSMESVGHSIGTMLGEDRYGIIFSEEEARGIASLDHRLRILYIDPISEAVSLSGYGTKDIKQALMNGFCYAWVRDRMKRHDVEEFAEIVTRCTRGSRHESHEKGIPLADIIELADSGTVAGSISPARLYTLAEVAKKTGYSNATLKRMLTSGVIRKNKDTRILGRKVEALNESMKGVTPLREVVSAEFPDESEGQVRQHKERSAIKRVDVLAGENRLPGYIKDISRRKDTPFYVIDDNAAEVFKEFLRSGELKALSRSGTYTRTRLGSEAEVVIYVTRLPEGIDMNDAQDMHGSIVDQTKVDGNTPFGVKHNGYRFSRDGDSFIVGTCYCMAVTGLDCLCDWLEGQGYSMQQVPKKMMKRIAESTRSQRAAVLPVVVKNDLSEEYAEVLEKLMPA